MNKPVCRVCGVAHWSREPHVFADDVAQCAECTRLRNQLAVAEAELERLRNQLKDSPGLRNQPKRDRAAYMRDYRSRSVK